MLQTQCVRCAIDASGYTHVGSSVALNIFADDSDLKSDIRKRVGEQITVDARAAFAVNVRVIAGVASVSFSRANVYLSGRYVKLERHLSQTPWIVDGVRKSASSVEEEIARPIVPSFGAPEHKFHTAGREDVDVRMLGDGRPLCSKLFLPPFAYISGEIEAFRAAVNSGSDGSVVINSLRMSSKAEFEFCNPERQTSARGMRA